MATPVPGYRTLLITLTEAQYAELETYVDMIQERDKGQMTKWGIRYTPEGIATGAVLYFLSEMAPHAQEGVK